MKTIICAYLPSDKAFSQEQMDSPRIIFDPEKTKDFVLVNGDGEKSPIVRSWLWPMLLGIHSIDWHHMLAHVAILVQGKEFHSNGNIAVCMTTARGGYKKSDIMPIIFNEAGECRVRRIWGSGTPLTEEMPKGWEGEPEEAWKRFFLEKIYEVEKNLHKKRRNIDNLLTAFIRG